MSTVTPKEIYAEKLSIDDILFFETPEDGISQHVIVSLRRTLEGIEVKCHPSGMDVEYGQNKLLYHSSKKVKIVDTDIRD